MNKTTTGLTIVVTVLATLLVVSLISNIPLQTNNA